MDQRLVVVLADVVAVLHDRAGHVHQTMAGLAFALLDHALFGLFQAAFLSPLYQVAYDQSRNANDCKQKQYRDHYGHLRDLLFAIQIVGVGDGVGQFAAVQLASGQTLAVRRRLW